MSGIHLHSNEHLSCHDHSLLSRRSEEKTKATKKLFIAMVINILIPTIQIAGGIYANSMAIISDATHNFSDFAALFIAYIAIKVSSRNPTPSHTYGFGKAEVIAAFINVFLLTAASVFILKEAIERFISGGVVLGSWVIGLALVGIVGNGFSAWLLYRDSEHSVNLRGAFLHMLADFLTSVAVFVVGCILLFLPWYWLDPLVSLAIVIFILRNCWSIFKEALKILMDATPSHISIETIRNCLKEFPDVLDVHHVHAWSISPSSTGFSCHVVVPDISAGKLDELTKRIKKLLWEKFSIDHPVVQFETVKCEEDDLLCRMKAENQSTPVKSEYGLWKKKAMILLRVAFGCVFVYASISKILNPSSFAEVIFNYSILPIFLINFVAVVLPWLECLAGLAVIFNRYIKGGLFVLNTLLIVFIFALVANIVRGININCGCFEASLSAATKLDMWLDVFRDAVLFIIGVFLWKEFCVKSEVQK